MTREDTVRRYRELYDRMSSGRDVKKMKAFGDAEMWAFMEMSRKDPETASAWLEKLEAGEWDSYISEREAQQISRSMRNQDGSTGFHWGADTFFGSVKSIGGKVEEQPVYNRYALLVAANMVYSDHARSIAQDMGKDSPSDVSGDRMALSCYRKALELLEDPDGGFRIRDYFRPVLEQR